VLDANEQFARMLGFSEASEVIGKNCWRYVGRQIRRQAISHIRANNEHPFEAHAITQEGEEFPIEVIGRSIPLNGQTVGALPYTIFENTNKLPKRATCSNASSFNQSAWPPSARSPPALSTI